MTARIIIVEPNGVQRTLPLTEQGLSIGRGTNSDVHINYPETSRSHAYISYEAGRFYVVDLDSGNGTYLGGSRLNPHEPTLWQPGIPLKIGEVTINLEQDIASARREQFQHPDRRQRDETEETMLGWMPPAQEPQKSRSWIWLAVLLVVGALCACSAMGTVVYFMLAGS